MIYFISVFKYIQEITFSVVIKQLTIFPFEQIYVLYELNCIILLFSFL